MHQKNDYLPVVAGLTVSFVFGFSFLFTKEGLSVLEPFHLLGLRFALALVIFLLLRMTGIIKINLLDKNPGPLVLLSLVEPVIYFICETMGIKLTSSSETGMMIAMVPVVTACFAVFLLKERPTPPQLGFIFLSVAGVIFITVMKGSVEFGGNLAGTLFVLGAVISAGLFNVFSRKLSTRFEPVEITYIMMWIGAIAFNGISIYTHIRRGNLLNYFAPLKNIKALAAVIYLGAFSSVVAYFALNYMLSRMEASRSAVFTNMATVISIFAGVVFGNEPFYWFSAVGGLMILAGVWGTNFYAKKEDGPAVRLVRRLRF
ncbi:DMT family transporter [Thermoanaerobacterium sp. DL9XJH110]|uniref:DMT family transporter n=1 Tax=Thermoanaerobacterium sp. DL9XJH110 TaxID=3386643 RepID=UPI003BB49A6E